MVKLTIKHQESYSRGELLLRTFFGAFYMALPHLFAIIIFAIGAMVLNFLSFWVVLFTGKFPRGWFDYMVKLQRWSYRLNARLLNLSDGYPAFGLNGTDDATSFDIDYPEKLSRGLVLARLFFGIFYVYIPHIFCLYFRLIWNYILIFCAWWAVLITGKYPKSMHDFTVGTLRWGARINAYMMFMTDQYPPFSGKEETTEAAADMQFASK